MKNDHYYEKIDVIPESVENKGSLYFNLKNNKNNHRGWKITLNKVKTKFLIIFFIKKGMGYDASEITANSLHILGNIFHKNIGRTILKDNKLSKLKLF